MSDINLQPLFPPRYSKENLNPIDWGNCGLIAYASGSCVHLSYARGNSLVHVSSIEIAPYAVSCFKFHLTLRAIAIADVKGRLFLYDIDHWRFIASAKPLRSPTEICLAMEWYDDVLLVLTSSRRLIAVEFSRVGTDKLNNMSILWETVMSKEFTRISIDPHYSRLLLLSTRTNSFGLYYARTPREKPELFVDTIELSEPAVITDAQWSVHMPGYIFIMLDRDLLLFHIQTRGLVAMIDRDYVLSGFSFLVQFPGDHGKLLMVHKIGSISIYQGNDEMWYTLTRTIQPSLGSNGIIAAALSPTNDAFMAVFSETQGLGLMDLDKMRITSMDLTFPAEITAYDSDADMYALGTEDGYLITGSLRDRSQIRRFKVSDESVRFVSFDTPLVCAYWQTSKDLGVLDVKNRSNIVFNSRFSSSIHCYGSHRGALIVMRDVTALGVFIDGKEKPLLFHTKIADVCVDDQDSTPKAGKFAVLLADVTVIFYKYSVENGISEIGRGQKLRAVESVPLSIATRRGEYAIGFSSGLIIFVNTETSAIRRVLSENTNVRGLVFGKGNNRALYGLCRDKILFECPENGKLHTCAYPVQSFRVVNENLIMVKGTDGIVKFIRIQEWEPLSYTSRFMLPPSEDDMLKDFIENRPMKYYHRLARDAWLTVTEKTNLRLQAVAGTSPSGLAERMSFALLERVDTERKSEVETMKFVSLLFQKRLDDAVNMRPITVSNGSEFLATALSSIFIFMSESAIDERAQARLKEAAIRLFTSDHYDDGVLLMRMASLDKDAADYLIDMGKIQLALRFIRSTVSESDKAAILFKLGVRLYETNRKKDAITIFSASGEYHPVLFLLLELGLVADAHFLLEYLKSKDKIRSCPSEYITQFRELNDLCRDIEVQYSSLCERLGIK